jgi:hypothetical protein
MLRYHAERVVGPGVSPAIEIVPNLMGEAIFDAPLRSLLVTDRAPTVKLTSFSDSLLI